MNIQKQKGFVSTLNLSSLGPGSEEFIKLRRSILAQAEIMSNFRPENQIDEYDESILTFKDHIRALSFLVNTFRTAVSLSENSAAKIRLKSSLCNGEYFLHQNQIYGDAVNLATNLSFRSRANELLVCGIDLRIIDKFVDSQSDLTYCLRDQEQGCVAIHLLDSNITTGKTAKEVLQLECNDVSKTFTAARNQRISIGRENDCEIAINDDGISRHHATITLKYGNIFIEDHSANGTYLYFDNREVFLSNDSMKLVSDGYISLGRNSQSREDRPGIISFVLCGETDPGDRRRPG
jgi:adenylate cyclase